MISVLIVEDEYVIRKGLAFLIDWMKAGCVIVGEASNGVEGLEKIRELKPDIVITDLKMPLMGGIMMLEESINEYQYEVIIISGYGEFKLAQRAIKIGVTEYLLKPIQAKQLYTALKKIRTKLDMKKTYNLVSDLDPERIKTSVIERNMYKNSSGYRSAYVRRILEYIKDNYMKNPSLADISNELNISESYVNQKLKEETNYTFNSLLNRYRIQQAIRLLQSESYKIYEVAEMTGFIDYKYFITVFKKYVGCSPKTFIYSQHAISISDE